MRGDIPGGDIHWRMHFSSSIETVFEALSTAHGRQSFWAESAIENKGIIEFRFANGYTYQSKIIESSPPTKFSILYFDTPLLFELTEDNQGGTDLLMTHKAVSEKEWQEVHAGWLNVLFPLKAYVDHAIDLRNHDISRSWDQGYADQ